jgi:hypothetical protein
MESIESMESTWSRLMEAWLGGAGGGAVCPPAATPHPSWSSDPPDGWLSDGEQLSLSEL